MSRLILWLIVVALFACVAHADTKGLTIQQNKSTVDTRANIDMKRPPADMPKFDKDEAGECDSDFNADASITVSGKQTDANHAEFTCDSVKITLDLQMILWLPNGSTQHVIDHEDHHRQISQWFYDNVSKPLAEKLAAPYVGKKFAVTGPDFQGNARKQLDVYDDAITKAYVNHLNLEKTQLRYDAINDHGRNDISAEDSMQQALKEYRASTQPSTKPSPAKP